MTVVARTREYTTRTHHLTPPCESAMCRQHSAQTILGTDLCERHVESWARRLEQVYAQDPSRLLNVMCELSTEPCVSEHVAHGRQHAVHLLLIAGAVLGSSAARKVDALVVSVERQGRYTSLRVHEYLDARGRIVEGLRPVSLVQRRPVTVCDTVATDIFTPNRGAQPVVVDARAVLAWVALYLRASA